MSAPPPYDGLFDGAPDVDALYVVSQTGLNDRTIPRVVEIATRARLPTFAQHGADNVRDGMLMSMSRTDFAGIGMFHASVVAKILNGASPRSLSQLFEEDSRITFNVGTAALIGLTPSPSLLGAADIVGDHGHSDDTEALVHRSQPPEFLVWLARRAN